MPTDSCRMRYSVPKYSDMPGRLGKNTFMPIVESAVSRIRVAI